MVFTGLARDGGDGDARPATVAAALANAARVLAGELAFVPIALWLHARWVERADRRRRGLCHRCGYDLRATPDRCPECGAAVAGQAPAAA